MGQDNQWEHVSAQEEYDAQKTQASREALITECQMGILTVASESSNVSLEEVEKLLDECETLVDEAFDGESLTEQAESAAEGFVGPGGVARARAKKTAELAQAALDTANRGASAELADAVISTPQSVKVPERVIETLTKAAERKM